MRQTDETGHHYGRLTVREYAGIDPGGGAAWLCDCECGRTITVRGAKLRQKRVVSCGCERSDSDVRSAARMKVPARRRKQIARLGAKARHHG